MFSISMTYPAVIGNRPTIGLSTPLKKPEIYIDIEKHTQIVYFVVRRALLNARVETDTYTFISIYVSNATHKCEFVPLRYLKSNFDSV